LELSCSQETVRRMLRDKEIIGIKLGNDWRLNPRAAFENLARQEDDHRAF